MHLQACYTIVALLFVLGFQVNANPFQVDYDPTSFQSLTDHGLTRSLRAAKAKSNLKARSIEGWLEHEIDLHYLDGIYLPLFMLLAPPAEYSLV
jgi:hypothetical protein